MAKEGEGKGAILVVDDDADIRLALEMLLSYEGWTVWTAREGREALARLDRAASEGRTPALVISDVKMPELDGLALLERIRERPGAPPVVMVSGHADVAMAVEAVRKGAADFLEKPLDQNRVLVSINNALRQHRLTLENVQLKRALAARFELLGQSPAMQALRAQIERVAPSDAAVLISGENGTGKEVVARNLHLASGARASGPFIAVNCAAIPSELIESELFGHEKGSFTGAHERRLGHFEAAHGGSLFLDEVGDMPLAAQAKVLRALETREITRVGGSRALTVDLRVLAASNVDLEQAVAHKTFRMDLFYRLNVIPLRVPPLRERREDIPLLCQHFLAHFAERAGRTPREIDSAALAALAAQEWPGNVRQLRNVLEAAQVFSDGPCLTRADIEQALEGLPSGTRAAVASLQGGENPFTVNSFEEFKNQSEALYIRLKLAENAGNVKRTAEVLGMQRSHLYKKLERYGLR